MSDVREFETHLRAISKFPACNNKPENQISGLFGPVLEREICQIWFSGFRSGSTCVAAAAATGVSAAAVEQPFGVIVTSARWAALYLFKN